MSKKLALNCLLLIIVLFCFSCGGSDENAGFPMDKKYWAAEDYHKANDQLLILNGNNSELPNLDNPKTASVFNKLVDTNNISVVANDNQLGLTNRTDFAKDIFSEYKDLARKYTGIDRQDKYKYPVELVRILKFGLALQVPYIQLENQK